MKVLAVLIIPLFFLPLTLQAQDTTQVAVSWDEEGGFVLVTLEEDELREVPLDTLKLVSPDHPIALTIHNRDDSMHVFKRVTFTDGTARLKEEVFPSNGVYLIDFNEPDTLKNIARYHIRIERLDEDGPFMGEIGGAVSSAEVEVPLAEADNLFVPGDEVCTAERLEELRTQLQRAYCPDVNRRPRNITLIHDWSTRSFYFCDPKKKNLTASTRDFVSMRVINFNPYRHEIEINNTLINQNTELQGQFDTLFAGKTADEEPAADSTAGIQAGVELTDIAMLEKMAKLEAELATFYEDQRKQGSLDVACLLAKVAVIDANIRTVFNIESVSSEAIIARANVVLKRVLDDDTVSEEDKKKAQGYVEQIKKAAALYAKVKNVQYVAHSAVVQPNDSDILQFTLTVKEDGKKLVDAQPYDFWLSGGLKVDFSSGLFVTGLMDEAFSTRDKIVIADADTTMKKEILQVDEGDFDLGFGVMAHFYWRFARSFNGGAALGAVANTGTEVRYLLGGSLILGRKQRFILNGGLAVGKVKRLGTGLEVGGFFEGSNSEVTRRDKRVPGWFLGVTYNLGVGNKASEK